METESGNYLNVTLKNKILSTDTVLDFMEYYDYKKKIMVKKLIIFQFHDKKLLLPTPESPTIIILKFMKLSD